MVEYPEYAEIDGELYKINTDYEYAVQCFNIINDNSISDIERAIAVVSVLFGREDEEGNIVGIPQNMEKAIEKVSIFLSCRKENKDIKEVKKDLDFEYDKELIYASFLSDYNRDLETERMHFWKYCSLISGLTEDSILNRVRDLRNLDLSEYKDSKTRAKLQEAKDKVALPEETELDEEDEEVLARFNRLLGDD